MKNLKKLFALSVVMLSSLYSVAQESESTELVPVDTVILVEMSPEEVVTENNARQFDIDELYRNCLGGDGMACVQFNALASRVMLEGLARSVPMIIEQEKRIVELEQENKRLKEDNQLFKEREQRRSARRDKKRPLKDTLAK